MDHIQQILELAESQAQALPPFPELPPPPQGAEIAAWIDHTLLKPEATAEQVKTLCQEAETFQFVAICINPAYVPLAAGLLHNSPVKIASVVGFPLGATLPTQKLLETLTCLQSGAQEIDMVMNIGALKGQAYGLVLNEIEAIAQVCHNQRARLKVILETVLLTRQEKILASLLCKAARADFVKTSTGFSSGGATVEDVELMRRVVGAEMGVKAAGGIRSLADAQAMIRAGATRLGSSSGVKIVQEAIA